MLALPETTPGSLYGLLEIFAAVGVAWEQMTGERAPARRVQPRIVAKTPIVSPLGLRIEPQVRLKDSNNADVVIVSDLALAPNGRPTGHWPEESAWMRSQWERGAVLCSVCTGSVFLAEAGLLDGLDATTHWAATGLFARYYPLVRLHPERIICPAGPEHRIVTAGGSGAWSDLALCVIARLCGAAEAVRISKIFVLGDRSDGQMPFAALGKPVHHDDATIRRSQTWVAEHYCKPNPVAQMVERSGVPERTFKRRFKAATGYTPIAYVHALRIEESKQLLETTDEPTDEVAQLVGYEDAAFFRSLFKRTTGVAPARYRRRYRSIYNLER